MFIVESKRTIEWNAEHVLQERTVQTQWAMSASNATQENIQMLPQQVACSAPQDSLGPIPLLKIVPNVDMELLQMAGIAHFVNLVK